VWDNAKGVGMMNRSVLHKAGNARHLNIAHIGKAFHGAFSEDEIFALNDMLLSSGQHTMLVQNMEVGHSILETFLALLQHYKNLYWLSVDMPVPEGCFDVYKHLLEAECLKKNTVDVFVDWIGDFFYADLLVIACSDAMMRQYWYGMFDQAMTQTELYEHVPIIQMIDTQYQ